MPLAYKAPLLAVLPLFLAAAAPEPSFILHCTYSYRFPQNVSPPTESYFEIDPAEHRVVGNTSGEYRDEKPMDGEPEVVEWAQISGVAIWFGTKLVRKDKPDVTMEEVNIDRISGTFNWSFNQSQYAFGSCVRLQTRPPI